MTLFGVLLLALGAASIYVMWRRRQRLHVRPLVDATTELVALIVIGALLLGVVVYRYRATRAAEKKLAAMDQDLGTDIPPPPKERPMRRRGDDLPPPPAGPSDAGPFRGAGASAPVQVIRTERPVSRPAVVPAGGEDHGPKILR